MVAFKLISLAASTFFPLGLAASLADKRAATPPRAVEAAAVTPLVNFQVQQPPTLTSALPFAGKKCTIELVHHLFASSYYQPAIIEYTPPTGCGETGKWAGVSLNYTSTSNGTQYDRLSSVTLSNVEIWRTSTAEPTRTGIIWTALKDVSHYIPLFAKPGRLILDLNNVIDTSIGIDGEYDVTLSVTFYTPSVLHPSAKSSDLIIPLSNFLPDQSNVFSVPPSYNVSVTFPTNTAAAYAEIYASGNSQEEFWYFNAANAYFNDLPDGATYNTGPFREVRLLVDGKLAGIAFPFPVIFTGGILPSLWRPISAIGSFDQPTYKVDLTPFLPLLCDGKAHDITLDVASAEADHSILGNWYLSGNIQVIKDSSNKTTTGSIISYNAPLYSSNSVSGIVTPGQAGTNDVNITLDASHVIDITSKIITGSGKTTIVQWKQNHRFHNFQSFLHEGNTQVVTQTSTGSSLSTHNGIPVVSDKFSYPLDIYYENIAPAVNSTGWYTRVDHAYDRTEIPSPLIIGSDINTQQVGSGTRLRTNGVTTSNGTTTQSFKFFDYVGNTYTRQVTATNSSIVSDTQGGTLSIVWPWPWPFGGSSVLPKGSAGAHQDFAGRLLKGQTRIW